MKSEYLLLAILWQDSNRKNTFFTYKGNMIRDWSSSWERYV